MFDMRRKLLFQHIVWYLYFTALQRALPDILLCRAGNYIGLCFLFVFPTCLPASQSRPASAIGGVETFRAGGERCSHGSLLRMLPYQSVQPKHVVMVGQQHGARLYVATVHRSVPERSILEHRRQAGRRTRDGRHVGVNIICRLLAAIEVASVSCFAPMQDSS